MMNTMPKQLGWVWEGDASPIDAPVRFYDAFGRMELLPLVFLSSPTVCASPSLLTPLLRINEDVPRYSKDLVPIDAWSAEDYAEGIHRD